MGIHTQAVQKLYVAYFSRPADVAGLQYWESVIAMANGSTAAVSAAFSASAEYQAAFAGKDEAGIITMVYQNLFGRAPEPAGLDFWSRALIRKDVTTSEVVTMISEAAVGSDKAAFANKVTGATAFSNALDLTMEILAYTGNKANATVKAFLAGITTDASLAAAIEPKALDAFIERLVTGDPPPPVLTTFDVTGLDKVFDTDHINAPGKLIEYIATGSVGSAVLLNVAPGSSFRALGDMGGSELSIIQRNAGPIMVALDADETAAADLDIETVTARVRVEAPTTLKVVFDSAFRATVEGEITTGDNVAAFHVAAGAKAVELVSGGTLANNVLHYTDTVGELATIKLTGASDLILNTSGTAALTLIDASTFTGRLTMSTALLANGGSLMLGSGADHVTLAPASSSAAPENIVNFAKAAAAAVGSDTGAASAAQAVADILSFGQVAAVANANPAVTTGTIVNGVLKFTGAGPTDLGSALAIANLAAETPGELVVFEYVGRSYAFLQGSDLAVQLVGVTGVTHIAEVGSSDTFFIV
ncbi:DUF4214 domain-containing protein [Massilia cavernae]|nr:DUF4214 domain-containing protein [Massilia cavernae]